MPALWGIFAVIGNIWSFISGFKLFWATLRNWSEIKRRLEEAEDIVERMAKTGWPTADDVVKLIDDTKFLFEQGFLDIPGIDENSVARQLDEVEKNLTQGLKPQLDLAAKHAETLKKIEEVKNGQ